MTPLEIEQIRERLKSLRASMAARIRDYPTPIAGCDQQFNYLLELRDRIGQELKRLEESDLTEEQQTELTAFLKSLE